MELWHNPRCTKSRQAKARLDDAGVEYVERRYLDDPPTVAELASVVAALGIEPRLLIRTADARALELDLDAAGDDPQALLELMAANPRIIQRPVLIADDGRAVLGRPPESVDSLIG
ncbi:arsenate reductase family protein [Euzebya sp.]|uniref:arsenate reductase family protein n=1 Tax=Euzebya sp. TaxID=1971409 RepID=UPI0035118897